MAHTLSKSDFKVARSCATKLYYKELGYPSRMDDDPFLALLADGGYIVEAIAKLLHPDGQTMAYGPDADTNARRTMDALAAAKTTLFEATLLSNGKLARADILIKDGRRFDLLEVKSKSYSGSAALARATAGQPNLFRGMRGRIESAWRPYLEDVTFQCVVLRELFPDAEVHPHLVLVDTSRTTTIDLLHQRFTITRHHEPGQRAPTTTVRFDGDPARLRSDHFLVVVDVHAEVDELFDEVSAAAATFVRSLVPMIQRVTVPVSVTCGSCEYRVNEAAVGAGQPSGFLECWGERGRPAPHILELYHVGTLGGRGGPLANALIDKGECSVCDVPVDRLVTQKGEVGAVDTRRRIQITHSRHGTPWISDALRASATAVEYPLHFIDFETSALAVPYYAGMKPYQSAAFQWSCHTIAAPGAAPVHREWINCEDYFPNTAFARALRQCVGTSGTAFMWAHHERTVLRTIARQLDSRGEPDPALAAWILDLAGAADGDDDGRLVNLERWAFAGYFHPDMGGSTSLKYVLPAVWHSDPALWAAFPEYVRLGPHGPVDPYQTLPPILIGSSRAVVAEGTAAVRAYQAMLYGAERDEPGVRDSYRELLLQYCKLDTAAMVMVWDHWRRA
jgi:hypothetical protein